MLRECSRKSFHKEGGCPCGLSRSGVDKAVDRVARRKKFFRFVVRQLILDADARLGCFFDKNLYVQKIVVPGGFLVACKRLDDGKVIAFLFDLRIRDAHPAKEVRASLLKIFEVLRVIDLFHLVGIGVPDANFCFGDDQLRVACRLFLIFPHLTELFDAAVYEFVRFDLSKFLDLFDENLLQNLGSLLRIIMRAA